MEGLWCSWRRVSGGAAVVVVVEVESEFWIGAAGAGPLGNFTWVGHPSRGRDPAPAPSPPLSNNDTRRSNPLSSKSTIPFHTLLSKETLARLLHLHTFQCDAKVLGHTQKYSRPLTSLGIYNRQGLIRTVKFDLSRLGTSTVKSQSTRA